MSKKFRLTDKQYEHLKSIARENNNYLNGYQEIQNGILLQTAKQNIYGDNMQQLIDNLILMK